MSDVITDYHAKLFAHELSKRHSVADAEKLAGTLFDAQVDLNPVWSKNSCSFPMVIFQQPTQSFLTTD